MRVLVYPHDLAIGGSQLNAIEIAAATRDHGVEPIIFARPGALSERIADLGLELIESPDPGRRPSIRVATRIRALVAEREIDVIHGYEWPPVLELALSARDGRTPVVATVMSMAVAPFIPRSIPLIVGTHQIAAAQRSAGRPTVHLLEPPVDLAHNAALTDDDVATFRRRWHLDESMPIVAIVSRLVPELKLEGILTAIEVAGCSTDPPFQLVVAGDGSAVERVRSAAATANRAAGRAVVVLTGELSDPRPAYAAADVCIGMGGSALRALAFGKPLVVQGEHGYFEALTPESEPEFRWRGWYGVGDGIEHGAGRLRAALAPLLRDRHLRVERGEYGARVVRGFALDQAAHHQVRIYRDALRTRPTRLTTAADAVTAIPHFAAYKASTRLSRWRGQHRVDDFNPTPLPVAVRRPPSLSGPDDAGGSGPVLYFPGVPWSAVPGTDHHLARVLARDRHVVWVDPPQSMLARRRRGVTTAAVSHPTPNLTRLHVRNLPGVTRLGLRRAATWWTTRAVRQHLCEVGIAPGVVIASCTEPVLPVWARLTTPRRIYYATDDVVAAAGIWGMSERYLHRARERNLEASTTVLAVSPDLADLLRRGPTAPEVLPNGYDPALLGSATVDRDAVRIPLSQPIAGVIGQFNERTDLRLLRQVVDEGTSLLLVGPRSFATPAAALQFTQLVDDPRVHWEDRVPPEQLPGFLRLMSVGLVPYIDSPFNRRCSPLKVFDYLAAGVPVVIAGVLDVLPHCAAHVRIIDEPERFGAVTREMATASHDPAQVRRAIEGHSWVDRAARLDRLISASAEAGARGTT